MFCPCLYLIRAWLNCICNKLSSIRLPESFRNSSSSGVIIISSSSLTSWLDNFYFSFEFSSRSTWRSNSNDFTRLTRSIFSVSTSFRLLLATSSSVLNLWTSSAHGCEVLSWSSTCSLTSARTLYIPIILSQLYRFGVAEARTSEGSSSPDE